MMTFTLFDTGMFLSASCSHIISTACNQLVSGIIISINIRLSSVLFFEKPFQTAIGVLLAMDHMKAASSLAIVVTTALWLLPCHQSPESGAQANLTLPCNVPDLFVQTLLAFEYSRMQ